MGPARVRDPSGGRGGRYWGERGDDGCPSDAGRVLGRVSEEAKAALRACQENAAGAGAGQVYRQQYGFIGVYLQPVNLYGPGGHSDLESSHVILALIRKCVEAVERGELEGVCRGDGSPTREFLYLEDCMEAIVLATERYGGAEPVNIGAGAEISIKELACLIAELTGFRGRILWDNTKPTGPPRRCLDTHRARKLFGFQARADFCSGLRRTVDWYRENRGHA